MRDLGSRIQHLASRILDPESRILDSASRIVDGVSRIQDPGSRDPRIQPPIPGIETQEDVCKNFTRALRTVTSLCGRIDECV